MATIEKEKVNFLRGNKDDYNSLAEKNNNTIYFILDTHEIYVGDKLFSTLDFNDLVNIPYIPTEEEMQGIFNALLEKQPKEEGKGLSTNDFTDEFKTKLISLFNYDDTDIKSSITNLNTALEQEANERAALGNALAAETAARESLGADLASEISTRQSEDAKLNAALEQEAGERETVGLALLEEVQAREAVGRALTTEVADRKALGVDLANEITNRQNADANLNASIEKIGNKLFEKDEKFRGFITLKTQEEIRDYILGDEGRKNWADGEYAILMTTNSFTEREEEDITIECKMDDGTDAVGIRATAKGYYDEMGQPIIYTKTADGQPYLEFDAELFANSEHATSQDKRIEFDTTENWDAISFTSPAVGTWTSEKTSNTNMAFSGAKARRCVSNDDQKINSEYCYNRGENYGKPTPMIIKINTANIDSKREINVPMKAELRQYRLLNWNTIDKTLTFDFKVTVSPEDVQKEYKGIYVLTKNSVFTYNVETKQFATKAEVKTQVEIEAEERTNADSVLQANIDNETNARVQAVSEEANTRAQAITAEENARQQGLIDEANARNSADLVLQNNINNEQNARINAVSEEATARANAVNNVQRNIDAEQNARIAADTTINTLITSIKKQLFDETNHFLGFIDINNSADAYKYLINDEERKTWADGKYAIAFLEDKIKARKEEIVTVSGQGTRPQNPGEQDSGKQPVVVTMKGIGTNNKFYKSSVIGRPEAVITMDIYSDDWFAKTQTERIVITNVVDTNGLLSSVTSIADPHEGTPLQGWEEDYTDTSFNFDGHAARKMISMDGGHQDNIRYYQATYPGEGTPFVLKFNTENVDGDISGFLRFTVQYQDYKKPTIGAGSWKKSNEADVTFDVPYTFVAAQEEKYYQGIYRLTNSKVVQYIPEDHATQQWVEENYATKTELSNWRQYKVVSNLDDVAEPQSNIIYLVYNANYSSTDNVYDEYIWVAEKGLASYWEHLGSTAINIQNYQKKLTAGDNITIDESNVISANAVTDYNDLTNQPIKNLALSGSQPTMLANIADGCYIISKPGIIQTTGGFQVRFIAIGTELIIGTSPIDDVKYITYQMAGGIGTFHDNMTLGEQAISWLNTNHKALRINDSASDNTIPTSNAVKTYVDNLVNSALANVDATIAEIDSIIGEVNTIE